MEHKSNHFLFLLVNFLMCVQTLTARDLSNDSLVELPNRVAWYLKDCLIDEESRKILYSAWQKGGFQGVRIAAANIFTQEQCPQFGKAKTVNTRKNILALVPMEKVAKAGYIYKKCDNRHLEMHVFRPRSSLHCRAVFLYFHGGGWETGGIDASYPICEFIAYHGITAMAAEYRTSEMFGGTPFNCVSDAKSAVRWVRSHCIELGIDSTLIVIAGGSAGGQLAAAVAVLEAFNEPGENMNIRCTPDATVLIVPVLNNGPDSGYGYNLVKKNYQQFSPLHNIKGPIGPLLVFAGKSDPIGRIQDIQKFVQIASSPDYPVKLITLNGGHEASSRLENKLSMYMTILDFFSETGFLNIPDLKNK